MRGGALMPHSRAVCRCRRVVCSCRAPYGVATAPGLAAAGLSLGTIPPVGGSAPPNTTEFYRSRDSGTAAYGAVVIEEWAEDRPKWEQIADVIRARIADGTYPPGTRVPSVQQLVTDTGVAVDTAQKVLARLREEGAIYTVRGLGSFVADPSRRLNGQGDGGHSG